MFSNLCRKAPRSCDCLNKISLVGIIGITLNTDWQVPKNPDDEKDLQASDRAIHFMFGWFLNPVTKGDYPGVMKDQVDRKSRAQGYTKSRLPEFSAAEKAFIKGFHLTLSYPFRIMF